MLGAPHLFIEVIIQNNVNIIAGIAFVFAALVHVGRAGLTFFANRMVDTAVVGVAQWMTTVGYGNHA